MNLSVMRSWRLVLGALVTGAGTVSAAEAAVSNPAASLAVTKPAVHAAWQERFTLGPGDVLNFAMVGSPELNREGLVIGPDDRVSYLQAQDVTATGLTIDELRSKFDQVLTNYYKSPHTIITPAAYRSKKYIMLGAVASKGVFPFDRPLTVIEAISRAGGFELGASDKGRGEAADLSRSFLVRNGERTPVDFEKLFQQGDLTQNVAIEPDDFLYFPRMDLSEVYLLGEVQGPGAVAYKPNLTLIAALNMRGGYTDRAWRKRILVVRGSLHNPVTFVVDAAEILLGRAPDFKLQPRDIVYVHERPWIVAEDLLRVAVTSFVNAAFITYTGQSINLWPVPKKKP